MNEGLIYHHSSFSPVSSTHLLSVDQSAAGSMLTSGDHSDEVTGHKLKQLLLYEGVSLK